MKYFINFHTNQRQYNSKLWWTRWKKITTKIKSIFLYWSLQQSVTKFSSTPLSVTRNTHVDKTCLTRKFEPKEFFYLWTFTFNNASTTIFSTQASLTSTSILTIIAIELIYICIQSKYYYCVTVFHCILTNSCYKSSNEGCFLGFCFRNMFLLYKENKFRTLFLHTEIHLNPQDFTGKRGEPCVANSWISMIRNYNRHKQLPKVQYLILTSIHSNTSSFLAFLFNIRFLSSSCIFAECCVAEPTFCDELTWPRANSIFCRRILTPNSTLSGNKKRILRENSLFHCKKSDMEILNLFT